MYLKQWYGEECLKCCVGEYFCRQVQYRDTCAAENFIGLVRWQPLAIAGFASVSLCHVSKVYMAFGELIISKCLVKALFRAVGRKSGLTIWRSSGG